jgi:hypothetical protein
VSRTSGVRPRWTTAIVLLGSFALVVAFVVVLGSTTDSSTPQAEASPTAREPAPTRSASPTPRPRPQPTPTPTADATVRAPVLVFNQTATAGLAASASASLQAGGWEVAETADATLGVPSTTLYVPPGLEDAAAAFGQQFPAVQRQRPAFAGLSTSGLTLVLADPDAVAVVAALQSGPGLQAAGAAAVTAASSSTWW